MMQPYFVRLALVLKGFPYICVFHLNFGRIHRCKGTTF
jgi:hypothetical protein